MRQVAAVAAAARRAVTVAVATAAAAVADRAAAAAVAAAVPLAARAAAHRAMADVAMDRVLLAVMPVTVVVMAVVVMAVVVGVNNLMPHEAMQFDTTRVQSSEARWPLWVSLLVLLTTGAAFGTFFWYTAQNRQSPAIDAMVLATRGDFADAVAKAQTVLQTANPASPDYQVAQSVVSASKYFGGTSADSVVAVQSIKQQITQLQGNPTLQALLVDKLIDAVNASRDPAIVAEVFKDEPFASLFVKASVTDSIKNLAEYSLSLAETSSALFALGNWHAVQIVRDLDGITKLSDADLNAHVVAIKEIIARADALHATESAQQQQLAFGYLYEPSFAFSRGVLYGILALIDKKYLAQSESSFQQVFTHFSRGQAEAGTSLAILEPRLPYAHLDEALFINEVSGSARADDVQAHLREILSSVEDSPSIHQKFFIAFIRSAATAQWPGAFVNRVRILKLAQLDPDFKAFLKENGWKF